VGQAAWTKSLIDIRDDFDDGTLEAAYRGISNSDRKASEANYLAAVLLGWNFLA
jgi:hypothetical protein